MIDKEKIKDITRQFLIAIGEDPTREGLIDTPRRVAEMCDEFFSPVRKNGLFTTFDADNYDGIVLVRDIDFSSVCEHHLMPFFGKAHIAYIPKQKIIGISKLARIIDKHTKKLQLQEKLANDIASELLSTIDAKGVAIYLESKHLCMNIRGVTRRNAATITTVFLGDFLEMNMQQLFISLVNISGK